MAETSATTTTVTTDTATADLYLSDPLRILTSDLPEAMKVLKAAAGWSPPNAADSDEVERALQVIRTARWLLTLPCHHELQRAVLEELRATNPQAHIEIISPYQYDSLARIHNIYSRQVGREAFFEVFEWQNALAGWNRRLFRFDRVIKKDEQVGWINDLRKVRADIAAWLQSAVTDICRRLDEECVPAEHQSLPLAILYQASHSLSPILRIEVTNSVIGRYLATNSVPDDGAFTLLPTGNDCLSNMRRAYVNLGECDSVGDLSKSGPTLTAEAFNAGQRLLLCIKHAHTGARGIEDEEDITRLVNAGQSELIAVLPTLMAGAAPTTLSILRAGILNLPKPLRQALQPHQLETLGIAP